MEGTLCWQHKNGRIEEFTVNLGKLPIMIQSKLCYLNGLTRDGLVKSKEDEQELGGYFIINGNEKVIRMLISEKRNQFICLKRASFKERALGYSDIGLLIKSVRNDEYTCTNILHYIEEGGATMEFIVGNGLFLCPVILLLRALKETTDREIYNTILRGNKNKFLSKRIELMLRESKSQPYGRTQKECLSFIGDKFRRYIRYKSKYDSDQNIGMELLDKTMLVHCTNNLDKFNLICLGLNKLYSYVEGKLKSQTLDGCDNQEVITSGSILARIIERCLENYLFGIKLSIVRYCNKKKMANKLDELNETHFDNPLLFEQLSNPLKIPAGKIGEKIEYFLSTGNLPYKDRSFEQDKGWCISADRINYFRFLSHFRAVHRGAMWTDTNSMSLRVRKLRPESFGFMCPVHTPDGAPCGLLNHLSEPAKVLTYNVLNHKHRNEFIKTLVNLNMFLLDSIGYNIGNEYIPVTLNGVLIGYVLNNLVKNFLYQLRLCKIYGKNCVSNGLEIIPVIDWSLKIFPEITLVTTSARMIRPIKHIKSKRIEWVSPTEQMYMDIAIVESEINDVSTHVELNPQSMLSVLAGLTPFSDNNQSPRNMYQCQMLKQAMGTFAQNMDYRNDNKAYRLQTPQTPLVVNDSYKKYFQTDKMDEYPAGTNTVVAVISYTGYDIEDAMIINKQSMERGFKHGFVYTTEIVDLEKYKGATGTINLHLTNVAPNGQHYDANLDDDGLPRIGTKLTQGKIMYMLYDDIRREFKPVRYKKKEPCVIEMIKILETMSMGNDSAKIMKFSMKLRFSRNPIIGDKFASRAGQKGTLAQLWPMRDMPFTEQGIVPDLIINPHAFPSRMTIGMLLESNAGKTGSIYGKFFDGTPFKFNEINRGIDHFGKLLLKKGYNYYGNESMYSGITGVKMKADIYFGLVYYQRLRHMVSDKYQVRALGPVNNLTKQPLKGRKRRGGIRLGEMERDSLISHGCSFLLHDRLFHNSDGEIKSFCKKCKTHLSVHFNYNTKKYYCRICNNNYNLCFINIPHVFCYLVNELAAVNVRLTLDVK